MFAESKPLDINHLMIIYQRFMITWWHLTHTQNQRLCPSIPQSLLQHNSRKSHAEPSLFSWVPSVCASKCFPDFPQKNGLNWKHCHKIMAPPSHELCQSETRVPCNLKVLAKLDTGMQHSQHCPARHLQTPMCHSQRSPGESRKEQTRSCCINAWEVNLRKWQIFAKIQTGCCIFVKLTIQKTFASSQSPQSVGIIKHQQMISIPRHFPQVPHQLHLSKGHIGT